MLDRLFGYKIHSILHVLGFCVLAFGMPLNKVLISIGAIWGVSNLVLEADFRTYALNLRKNKIFLWLSIFCLYFVAGLLWTDDFAYAFHDLLIKLPLFAVPLALAARPINNRKHLHLILYCLLASLLLTTFLNLGNYLHWFGSKTYTDIREMSLFGSHIRYGILVALGAGICLYFLQMKSGLLQKIAWTSLFCWFLFYTYYSQILSGVIALLVVIVVTILFILSRKSKLLAGTTFILLLALLIGFTLFLVPDKTKAINRKNLPVRTAEGNPYTNDFSNKNREGNQLVFISYCDLELKREWEKRSTVTYEGKDKKGQSIRSTIIRYLASKNLSKDAEGIANLSAHDVQHIEEGIANVALLQSGIISRWHGIKYQLNNNYDPNGHSLLQRLEYWKTAGHIIQNHWLFGVGIGDVPLVFQQQYKTEKTNLTPINQLRAHNMYLTVWISVGIVGLILFLIMLGNYFWFNSKQGELIPLFFIAIACVTFLIEDTLETQLGVSIFAFFFALFINPVMKQEE